MDESESRWDREELENAATTLDGFLLGNELHQSELLEVLDHHLMGAIGPETSNLLYEAISFYSDEDFAGVFMGYLAYGDQDEELRDRLQGLVSPVVGTYLKKTLAMHGAKVTEAAVVFGEDRSAWRDLRREVFLDVIGGEWRVRVEIDTYGGQTITLNETPTSTLVLAHAVLDTVMAAIENAGIDVLDPESIPPFIERIQDFLDAAGSFVPEADGYDSDPAMANAGTYL